MILLIDCEGNLHTIYSEELDLAALGKVQIRRASCVEPDEQGQWWANLSPVGGPKLGAFAVRSVAIAAEVTWLRSNLARIISAESTL